eukprot:EG_transcript_62853
MSLEKDEAAGAVARGGRAQCKPHKATAQRGYSSGAKKGVEDSAWDGVGEMRNSSRQIDSLRAAGVNSLTCTQTLGVCVVCMCARVRACVCVRVCVCMHACMVSHSQ